MSMPEPQIARIDTLGDLEVWEVDGNEIRSTIDPEFTNFGQHYRYSYIPENELWIDTEATPDEYQYFTDHLLVERRLMKAGMPYDQAVEKADKVERRERRRSVEVTKLTKEQSSESNNGVYIEFIKDMGGLKVWKVDGKAVRDTLDIDFTEGGNGYVYPFIPRKEIWIDNDLDRAEIEFVISHEFIEANFMALGYSYDKAHSYATHAEYSMRQERAKQSKEEEQI